MKRKRFPEEKVVLILEEMEAGATSGETACRHGVAVTTLFRWSAKCGGLEVSDTRKLREPDEGNRRLKKLVADQALNIQVLKQLLGEVVTAARRRKAVTEAMVAAAIAERVACRYLGIARSTARSMSKRPSDLPLRTRLVDLADERPRWGYRRLHVLLQREGGTVNRKRVSGVYTEAGLAVRRRKRLAVKRTPAPLPDTANIRWSMDFVSDTLSSGRLIRCQALR